jgi:hypothetical protein
MTSNVLCVFYMSQLGFMMFAEALVIFLCFISFNKHAFFKALLFYVLVQLYMQLVNKILDEWEFI